MAVERQLYSGSTPLSSTTSDTESFKELLKQLAGDASQLIRQEIELAKIEMKESVSGYAADAARIGIAAVIGGLGAGAFTAFLIIALAQLVFGNNYWLSALVVAVLLLGTAAALAVSALRGMRLHGLTPAATIGTLKADSQWAKHELAELKQTIKS